MRQARRMFGTGPKGQRGPLSAPALSGASGGGGGALIARLTGFVTNGLGVKYAFAGFLIESLGQDNPDPVVPIIVYSKRYPEAVIGKDLEQAIPGIPFGTLTPGEADSQNEQADVFVFHVTSKNADPVTEPDGLRYYLASPMLGVCLGVGT